MKFSKVRFLAFVFVFPLFAAAPSPVFAVAAAADQPSFEVSAEDRGYATGDEVRVVIGDEIRVVISGTRLVDVYAYEINLEYDALRLELAGMESAVSGFSTEPIRRGAHVRFGHTKIGEVPGDSGDVVLGTATFRAIAGGNATILLREVSLVDSQLEMATYAADVQIAVEVGRPGPSVRFSDIDGHWAETEVRIAADRGIVTGYEDGTFRSEHPITRAEFAALLVRALGVPEGDGDALSFADSAHIPAWARPYAVAAVAAGLMERYEDGTFRASSRVARAEAAAAVVRAAGIPVRPSLPSFADSGDIPAWARDDVAAGAEAGLIFGRGDNRFVPNADASRAEAVALILRMLQL